MNDFNSRSNKWNDREIVKGQIRIVVNDNYWSNVSDNYPGGVILQNAQRFERKAAIRGKKTPANSPRAPFDFRSRIRLRTSLPIFRWISLDFRDRTRLSTSYSIPLHRVTKKIAFA